MSLVAYSDSEPETEGQGKQSVKPGDGQSRKRKRENNGTDSAEELPPLPESFHDLYSHNPRASTRDDPSLHGGRKRTVPHVEGNWPTHVYLEWHPKPPEYRILSDLIDAARSLATPEQEIHSLLLSQLSTPQPLHVSLSRPLILLASQREQFLASLDGRVQSSGVRPFCASLSDLKWVSNWDKSRWFLVLSVLRPPGDELNRILWESNATAEEFALGKLYDHDGTVGVAVVPPPVSSGEHLPRRRSSAASERPRDFDRSGLFHFSLAWSLIEPRKTGSLESPDIKKVMQQVASISVNFSVVKVKVGNAINSIELAAKPVEKERGILG